MFVFVCVVGVGFGLVVDDSCLIDDAEAASHTASSVATAAAVVAAVEDVAAAVVSAQDDLSLRLSWDATR